MLMEIFFFFFFFFHFFMYHRSSEKLIAMKKQVIESFVCGCELAVQLNETSLVENSAVYLWNFHLHVFRDINGIRPSRKFFFFFF